MKVTFIIMFTVSNRALNAFVSLSSDVLRYLSVKMFTFPIILPIYLFTLFI